MTTNSNTRTKTNSGAVAKTKNRLRLAGLAAGLTAAASLLAPASPVDAARPDGLGVSAVADAGATTPTTKAVSSLTTEPRDRVPAPPSEKRVPPNCGVVPSVIGLTIEEAIATIEAASPLFWVHLDYGFLPEGQAEIGTIFTQSQAAGTQLFDCDGESAESGIFISAVLGYVP